MTVGVFVRLLLAIVCFCNIAASSPTNLKIRCHGTGEKATSCLVPTVKKGDLPNLKVDLICQRPPNGCDGKNFKLEAKRRKVVLTVSKNCKGLFNVKTANSNCGMGNVPASGFRIINGRKATSCNQFPWMVSLGLFCGATIINKNHLLTAAHCLQTPRGVKPIMAPRGTFFAIYIGTEKREFGKRSDAFAEKTFIHEDFNDKTLPSYAGDIAVIRLKSDLEFNDCVQPICLESDANKLKASCHVSGWGATQTNPFSYPSLLSWVSMKENDRSVCKSTYQSAFPPRGSFCAVADQSTVGGACNGDSGGPLACKEGNQWYQYGIVSGKKTEDDCGTSPGLYASIPYYYDWIQEKINSL